MIAKKQESVAIGRLERFVADWEASQGDSPVPPKPKKTGKKVAVCGSGPGGLICAGYLIQAGHDVTIFEALHKAGGMVVCREAAHGAVLWLPRAASSRSHADEP